MTNKGPGRTRFRKSSGRAVIDERGRSTWERRAATGTFRCDIDPERLKALAAALSFIEKIKQKVPPVDPYNNVTPKAAHGQQKGKRRSLDDMRRLSKAIEAKISAHQVSAGTRDTRKS